MWQNLLMEADEADQPNVETGGKRVLGSAAGTIEYTEGWDAAMSDEELDSMLGA